MSRQRICFLLALLLLSLGTPGHPADPAWVLSDDECQAPFDLSVPARVVRANRGLSLVMHADAKGQGLVFNVGLDALLVTLRSGGHTTELDRVAAPIPGADSFIVLKRLEKGFEVAYDGVTVARRVAELPAGGRWGLVGAPAAVLDKIQLQPLDTIEFSDDFMRTPDEPTEWENLSGTWQVTQLNSARYSANAFTLVGSAAGSKSAQTTAGYWFWQDLTVEASVRPSPGAEGFGIGLACQPSGEAYLLRFLAQAKEYGKLQLVRTRAGGERVLAEAPVAVGAEDWHRLALSGVGGRLAGALDGVQVITAEAPDLAHGKIALWVAGPQAVAFDDVEAYSGPREAEKPVILSHEAQTADPRRPGLHRRPVHAGVGRRA